MWVDEGVSVKCEGVCVGGCRGGVEEIRVVLRICLITNYTISFLHANSE